MRIQNKKYYIKGEEFNSFKAAMREELWKRMFVLGVGISDEIILKNVVDYVSVKMFFEMSGKAILSYGDIKFPSTLRISKVSENLVAFELDN